MPATGVAHRLGGELNAVEFVLPSSIADAPGGDFDYCSTSLALNTARLFEFSASQERRLHINTPPPLKAPVHEPRDAGHGCLGGVRRRGSVP
ncbi:hypothetical protein [Sorangium sp. So ce887]|uniref:hypothetical protein n=1 Tax=Sorangium sp. So ce887 TaxID=3133324 RepID=UPI003F634E0C